MDQTTLRSCIANIPMALIVVDRDERVVAANAAARALFGTLQEGRPSSTVLRHPGFLNAVESALKEGWTGVARASMTGQGAETLLAVHASPIGDGADRMAMIAFEDLTAAERAEAMRRDFVANVSHELRTPLTALVGFIETLKGAARDDPAARERFLGIMEREAGRMIRLVNDLLSLSRVESEERRRPSDVIDVVALLRSAKAALRDQAKGQGVELALAAPEGPVTLRADSDQMTQVFHNLIENAVKYGGPGKTVHLSVRRIDRDPVLRGPAVQIAVRDEGEGIDEIHLPRLTERFYRVDTHRSREKGGTGLGLAIVKHIVNRHRGRLKIESEAGKGSVFTVILPEA